MAKKNKEELKEVKEVEEQFLTDGEIREIEKFNQESQLTQKNLECVDLKIRNMEMEVKLKRMERLELVRNFKDRKISYEKFLNELKKKYNIIDSFSFNPETGQIIV